MRRGDLVLVAVTAFLSSSCSTPLNRNATYIHFDVSCRVLTNCLEIIVCNYDSRDALLLTNSDGSMASVMEYLNTSNQLDVSIIGPQSDIHWMSIRTMKGHNSTMNNVHSSKELYFYKIPLPDDFKKLESMSVTLAAIPLSSLQHSECESMESLNLFFLTHARELQVEIVSSDGSVQ